MAVHDRRSHLAIRWLRQALTVAALHAVALVTTYLLFVLGETLFAGYAGVVREAALPRDPTQVSWLQRMASDVERAVGWVVVLSAVLQVLLSGRRVLVGPPGPTAARQWRADLSFGLARALRGVGIGLATVAWVSVLGSETRLNADARTYATVAATVAGVGISHWFTRVPGGSRRRGPR